MSQQDYCCSLEAVEIGSSMASCTVKSTRSIIGGIKQRRGNETVFLDLFKSDDVIPLVVYSQHRSSKILSSISPQALLNITSSFPQSPSSCSSSTPLLAQLKIVPQKLEESSLRGAPEAVTSPFVLLSRTGKSLSCSPDLADAGPASPLRALSSAEFPKLPSSPSPFRLGQTKRGPSAGLKGELQLSRLHCGAVEDPVVDPNRSKQILILLQI